MRLFGETLKNGDEVQIVLNNDYHGYAGNVIIENDVIIEVTSYNGKQTYKAEEIQAIAPYSREFDLSKVIRKEMLLKMAQEYAVEKFPDLELKEIHTDMIHFTEYQRALFEQCYFDKEHLKYVNWFAPSACYYPVGWYNLGGKSSKKANNIGELVDSQWQAWRNALLQNMWLNNITSEKITYKGL